MARFNVDFTNAGDGFQLVPEGDYICKVSKITVEDGTKGKYLKWEFVIGTGDYKGQKLYHNTSLLPQALFNLRNTIIALGIDVPKSAFSIDTEKYVGKIVGITVTHREYTKDGQKKKTTDIAELWRAIKTAKGWGRSGAKDAILDKPAAKPKEDEEEVPFDVDAPVNGVDDSDVEEIEI